MPLDGNLPPPTLRTLSTILRDRRCWPKGFVWDYSSCTECAMGLAHQLFKEIKGADRVAMAEGFKIPEAVASEIFINLPFTEKHRNLQYDQITPEMVADAIDQYLVETSEKVFTHAV